MAGAAGPGRGGGGGGLEPGLRSLGAPAAGAGAAPPGGHAADGLADAGNGIDSGDAFFILIQSGGI